MAAVAFTAANADGIPAGRPLEVDDPQVARLIVVALEDEATRLYRWSADNQHPAPAARELAAGEVLAQMARQLARAAGDPDYQPPRGLDCHHAVAAVKVDAARRAAVEVTIR